MSEEGIDPVYETTKNLVTTNRLLWTGISVTNKKLALQVATLNKNTEEIKKLASVSEVLEVSMFTSTTTLMLGFGKFTNQFKDIMYHLAKIMTESFFGIVNSLQQLDRTLKDNTNMILRALGSEEHWKSAEEYRTEELIGSLNAFKGHTDLWVDFLADPAWGEKFWKAVQEDATDAFDKIYNWAHVMIGQVFEKQIGYIADKSQDFGKLKIELFENLENIPKEMRESSNRIFEKISKSLIGVLEGKKKEKYEINPFVKGITNFIHKLRGAILLSQKLPSILKKGLLRVTAKAIGLIQILDKFKLPNILQKGLDKANEFMKKFAKRQLIKAFQFGIGFLKQVINLGTAPGMATFTKMISSLAKIINVILIPLRPFLFMLELISDVLEAALSPMQAVLYEALQPLMQDLVQSLPDLMDMVNEWMEEEAFQNLVMDIISAFTGLITAITSGGLMRTIFDLTMKMLKLATTIISANLIVSLFSLTGVIAELAFELVKPGPGGKTLIEWIVELSATLGGFAIRIFKAFGPLLRMITDMDIRTFGRVLYGIGLGFAIIQGMSHGGIFGLALAGVYAGVWAVAASGLLSLQEGGIVPGQGPVPIMAHGGEQVLSVDMQEEMIELLQENNNLQIEILKMKQEKYR